MEAIVGVYLTSILGGLAFAAAGYVLGQRGVVIPLLGITAESGPDKPEPSAPAATTPRASEAAAPGNTTTPVPPEARAEAPSRADAATPPPGEVAPEVPSVAEPEEEVTRPTLVPGSQPGQRRAPTTAPPPADVAAAAAAAAAELESLRSDVQAALSRAEAAAQKARAAEVVRSELERQIETLRKELKQEVVARVSAEQQVQELGDRLAGASEEAATLRHKVSTLDKQAKQLREALQGRVRALTTSEWHRRRDLEEAEEIRAKLREVSNKLERTSLPPELLSSPPSGSPSSSDIRVPRDPASRGLPELRSTPPGAPAARSLRPSIDEAAALREEVARLTAENRSLRVRAAASMAPRPPGPRASLTDVNLEVYRSVIDRVGAVAGLRGAVVADEVGSVLVGSGEHAESLAAFGAYIKDASARANGLLPIEDVEEIDIRDRSGVLLSTVVVSQPPSELSVVFLGAAPASMLAAKKVVKDSLRRP